MKGSNGYGRCDDIDLVHEEAKEQSLKCLRNGFDIESMNEN
jgi:hypothetical protein